VHSDKTENTSRVQAMYSHCPHTASRLLSCSLSLSPSTKLVFTAARAMLPKSLRPVFRQMSSASASAEVQASGTAYPFSPVAKVLNVPPPSNLHALRQGKGLMAHLQRSFAPPLKQKWLSTFFSRTHPQRLLPGSVLQVQLEHAPNTFSGVLLSIRRRGQDTSFLLRNIVQRTGLEMQFSVVSPHLKDIRVIQRADGSGKFGGKGGKRQTRAKLFFLRRSPDKMSAISAGVRR